MGPANVTVLRLSARSSALDEHVETVIAALPRWAACDEVRVGLAEALGNAIVHGALGLRPRLDDPEDLERFLDELIAAEQASNAVVTVTMREEESGASIAIADHGPGFDWAATPRRPRRGLSIVEATFARVEWNAAGNVLLLGLDAPGSESKP